MYEKKSDLGSTDINTLTGEYSGFYYQGLNANATTARGYPVSSAGALLVIRNNANGNAGCTQLYFPYNATTGTFYMRQHIIQSSSSGWEWTAWKKFQSLDFTDSPQFTNLNLVRSSDVATTAGGILQSVLNDASGAQRARARFYSEFRGDGKSWATIHLQNGDKNQYAGLSEDGDFSLNSGNLICNSARLYSSVTNPLILQSAHPTIRINETDRPEGTPDYAFIFDGGNWRIEKNHWNTPAGGNCISYNYARNEIEVPYLKVAAMAKPADLEQTKTNMQIPFAGIAHWVDYNAPTGAEAGKYYPVIVSHPSYYNGDFLVEVAMRTKSISGSEEPNCNAIHLWLRDGGWSDMGAAAFGHYFCYAKNENAILCVRGTDKGQYPHNAIYVRGDAFPIRLAVTVGCNVTIPTADWKPANTADSPTYKWGITNSSDGIDLDTYGISNNLLDFTSSATGFYCTDTYRNKYGNPYLVVQQNGAIQPANGVEIYSNIDWNTQQSDNVSKFKPIAGNANTPESDLTYGGFHVGFNGTHATQFAGRNSKFFARSFEAGVDKGWCQLATLNASSQRWTGANQFKSTEFFTDTFSKRLALTVLTSTTKDWNIELWGSSSRPTVLEYKIRGSDGVPTKYALYAQQNTDDSIEFNVNGTVTCLNVNQTSDRDLKDNIQVIGDATEAIRKMNGYTYTLKENGLPYAGVIAQEVMEALPEAVGSFTHYGEALQGPTIDGNELREETRYLNVDYAAVTGLLVQVARETDNRVTELEEENARLRANIAVMDERITKLEALVRQLTGSEE
ncbi:tail fiber domain-containing protein [Escherichia coli]